MSADAAASIRLPRGRWTGLLFVALGASGVAAGLYLFLGDLDIRIPDLPTPAPAGLWLAAMLGLFVVTVILRKSLPTVESLNIVEHRRPDVVVWKTSRAARLDAIGDVFFNMAFVALVALFGWAAVLAEDWKRSLAAAFVIVLMLTSSLIAARRAIVGRGSVTIDGEGVRAVDLPGGGLSWSAIDRVTVRQKPGAKSVGIVAAGRTYWIDLEWVGVTGRRFLSRLATVAPQVEIDLPRGRFADYMAE